MPVFISKSCTILSTSRLSGSGDNRVIRVCAHALDEMASAMAATAIDKTRCFTASSFLNGYLPVRNCGAIIYETKVGDLTAVAAVAETIDKSLQGSFCRFLRSSQFLLGFGQFRKPGVYVDKHPHSLVQELRDCIHSPVEPFFQCVN